MSPDLKSSLDDLAEAEFAGAPASTVDIGKARDDGRRRLRTARLAPVGGGVAVVAACALLVNGLGGTSAAKPKTAPATNPAVAHEFTGTDPLTKVADIGYVPEGFQVAARSVGSVYGNSVTLKGKPAGTQSVSLNLTESATEPPLLKYETKKEVTVAGNQKAYLVTNPGDPGLPDDLSLHWQTASGSWYSLGGDYQIHGDQLRTLLIKVAESVTADDSAVPMPLHIEGLPKGALPAVATLASPIEVGKGGVAAALVFDFGTVSPSSKGFTITAMPSDWPGPYKIPSVNGLVQETVTDLPGVAQASAPPCKDSNGLHICVLEGATKNGQDPLASVGGAQGLLEHITSLGTDPANWTTHVVN